MKYFPDIFTGITKKYFTIADKTSLQENCHQFTLHERLCIET